MPNHVFRQWSVSQKKHRSIAYGKQCTYEYNPLVTLEKQNDLILSFPCKRTLGSSAGTIGHSSLEPLSAQAFSQTCGSSSSLSCHLIHQSSEPDPPVPKVRMKEHLPGAEVSVHGRRKVRGP